MKIEIEYTGGLDEKLDNKLEKFFEKEGFEFVGSGFLFKTQVRDLEFEKEV